MQIMINGLSAETGTAEIETLLRDMGVSVPFTIMLAPGLGEHPTALVSLDVDHAMAEALVQQLDGHFWHGKTLSANHTTFYKN